MECLHCGKSIGPIRKLRDQEYCSNSHREAHRKKQNALALDFLLKTKPHFAPEPRGDEQPEPVKATPAPATAQVADVPQPVEIPEPAGISLPIVIVQAVDIPQTADIPKPVAVPTAVEVPRPAEFSASRVPYAVPGAGEPQLYGAVLLVSPTALGEAEGGGPRASTFSEFLKAISHTPLAAISLAREICAVKSTPVGFACKVVRVHTSGVLAHPLWLGPSKIEPGRKQTGMPEPATFFKIRIDWNTPVLSAAGSRTAAPFEQVVTNSPADLPCTRPVFAAASFLAKCPTHMGSAPGHRDNSLAAAWQFSSTKYEWACAPVSHPRAIGFPLCPASTCVSQQALFPAAIKTARVPDPVVFELRPCETTAAATLRQPILALRSSQTIQPPATARAGAPKTGVRATHQAQFHIRLNTPRFRPVRPRDSLASPAAAVIPSRVPSLAESTKIREPDIRKPSLDIRLLVATCWRRVPGRARRTAAAAALVAVCGYAVSAYVQSSAGMRHRQAFQTQITRRAAIELEDDFRGGLSHWVGSAGWASTWSFDGTGTARCGKLALLEPSLALADYRIEFMGQIDKHAIAWVFRASDTKNYYATKLVETGTGPMPGLSLLRYVVIDGRQRMKVQLPLPVLPGESSMRRIRQEVRGTQFTTFLDGRLIDTWSDASLPRGGVGFFSDSGEVAYLRWVTIANQDDTLGRICAWLGPRLH